MSSSSFRYFMLNKVRGMESQFVSDRPAILLGEVDFKFPEGTHAVGRLDKDSEGLLLLTTNKKITALLFQSRIAHKRTYLVRVNKVSPENLRRLQTGVPIRVKGGEYYLTPPCEVCLTDKPRGLFRLPHPYKEYEPASWLVITLLEGKYHQIRKMVAAIGHRCQRLIRVSIEDMLLDGLRPGGVREFSEEIFFQHLKLQRPPMDACRQTRPETLNRFDEVGISTGSRE